VIDGAWVKPGSHVSSVGYHPPDGELPRDLARRHRLFVEAIDSFAAPPVGCAEITGQHGVTLGEVVNDPGKGRSNPAEITVYKAMGIAMEDLVAANLAYQAARRSGAGGSINL
jgi:ornithine cyclodeaminase/alanine dehydrogenase-like protein (mu-crystallin family)